MIFHSIWLAFPMFMFSFKFVICSHFDRLYVLHWIYMKSFLWWWYGTFFCLFLHLFAININIEFCLFVNMHCAEGQLDRLKMLSRSLAEHKYSCVEEYTILSDERFSWFWFFDSIENVCLCEWFSRFLIISNLWTKLV